MHGAPDHTRTERTHHFDTDGHRLPDVFVCQVNRLKPLVFFAAWVGDVVLIDDLHMPLQVELARGLGARKQQLLIQLLSQFKDDCNAHT